LTVVSKLKDFSRSPAITYAVKVAVYTYLGDGAILVDRQYITSCQTTDRK